MGKGYGQNASSSNKKDIPKSNSILSVELSEETFPENYLPESCPLGFIGLYSPQGDCTQYYDCKDGLLLRSHICKVGFKFDNGQGSCVSRLLVDSKCIIFIPETSNNQNEATDATETAQTNNIQNQIVESSEGRKDQMQSEYLSEEEQKFVAPTDNHSADANKAAKTNSIQNQAVQSSEGRTYHLQ